MVKLDSIHEELQDFYVTPRELDIIRELAESKSTKATAGDLGIAHSTVLNVISRANKRLKSNKYDLVYKAHLMGLIE